MSGAQVIFPGLDGSTTTPEMTVKPDAESAGEFVVLPAEATVLISEARHRLHDGARDRLAELREAAAQRRRELRDYDDPTDEAAERTELVNAFGSLQAETSAWRAED
jgi:hypothetical protein